VLSELHDLVPLAPLHQPYNLAAIEAVFERLPDVPQVACFDTSFHRGQSAVAELVPLPAEIRQKGAQRYGFHGLSYEYIRVGPSGGCSGNCIGSGHRCAPRQRCKPCAFKDRKSVDSSLGFTALDGICMGTRPGSIDPGVVLFLFQNLGLSTKEVETLLYKKSGLLGISGISNDMRDLLGREEPEAKLAVDYFVIRRLNRSEH
jgi:acetate kinase